MRVTDYSLLLMVFIALTNASYLLVQLPKEKINNKNQSTKLGEISKGKILLHRNTCLLLHRLNKTILFGFITMLFPSNLLIFIQSVFQMVFGKQQKATMAHGT